MKLQSSQLIHSSVLRMIVVVFTTFKKFNTCLNMYVLFLILFFILIFTFTFIIVGLLILFLAVIPCWAVHLNTESLLNLIGQDPDVTKYLSQFTNIKSNINNVFNILQPHTYTLHRKLNYAFWYLQKTARSSEFPH